MLAEGATREEILVDYPYLEDEDIAAVLEYAARQTDRPSYLDQRLNMRSLVDVRHFLCQIPWKVHESKILIGLQSRVRRFPIEDDFFLFLTRMTQK